LTIDRQAHCTLSTAHVQQPMRCSSRRPQALVVEGAIAKIMKPNDVARTLFSKERLDRNGLKQLIPDFDWDDFFLQFGYPDVGVSGRSGLSCSILSSDALHCTPAREATHAAHSGA
jgi:hypothetical protein